MSIVSTTLPSHSPHTPHNPQQHTPKTSQPQSQPWRTPSTFWGRCCGARGSTPTHTPAVQQQQHRLCRRLRVREEQRGRGRRPSPPLPPLWRREVCLLACTCVCTPARVSPSLPFASSHHPTPPPSHSHSWPRSRRHARRDGAGAAAGGGPAGPRPTGPAGGGAGGECVCVFVCVYTSVERGQEAQSKRADPRLPPVILTPTDSPAQQTRRWTGRPCGGS